ncbi:unnamed protein product [Urochloa humidicola]
MTTSHVASPMHRCHDDDDSPRRSKIRVGSPPRSSDAEADRRRRRWTATHRSHHRGSRASPPDPDDHNRGPRLSGDNSHCLPSGDADDRPARGSWGPNGEEDRDHMRRSAGVPGDEMGDDESHRRKRRSRSDVEKDDHDRRHRRRWSHISEPGRSCPHGDRFRRKDSHDEQLNWDALKKNINGLVNKVNASNIKDILPELFALDLVRGRGLLCESCIQSQMASPDLTDVFAALVAAVNAKFPEIGRLLLVRVMLQLKSSYERSNKLQLLAATKFIAHLVNQVVAHESMVMEIVTMFLEKNPTADSVEVAVGFVQECGMMLQVLSPQRLYAILERFRGILDGGEIDKRVQFLIEGLFTVREAQFKGFPAVRPELVLVEQRDQSTHEISLEDDLDPENNINVLGAYPNFHEAEMAYGDLRRSIQGSESSENAQSFEEQMDRWTDFINKEKLRLAIMSGVDFPAAGLMKINFRPGQEMEVCRMIIECSREQTTYLRYFGLLAQRYCMMRKAYQENFEKCFVQEYSVVHCLQICKVRTVAKFFAHLLETDTLPWHVLACIQLTEEGTTSSSRIFVRILFQELLKRLGIRLLNERLNDPGLQGSLESIFRKDRPKNTSWVEPVRVVRH